VSFVKAIANSEAATAMSERMSTKTIVVNKGRFFRNDEKLFFLRTSKILFP
jgi:hypothetical protein